MTEPDMNGLVDGYMNFQKVLFSAMGVAMCDADVIEDHRGQPWGDFPQWLCPRHGHQRVESHRDSISKGGLTFFYCENNGHEFWVVFSDKDRDEDHDEFV